MSMTERRRDARFPVARPVKLQCINTGRYVAGRTSNVSSSGALLELATPSLLVPGQRLKMGVAWTRGQTIIPAERMTECTVVRSMGLGGVQHVALVFDQPQQLAATA